MNEKLRRAMGKRYKFETYGNNLNIFTMHDSEILLAGPKGTGKSLAILHKVHLVLSKYPGAKGLMVRKTRASMTDSCIDMFNRFVLKPEDKVKQHKQEGHFIYPNKSLLAYTGLDESLKLQSSEWDIIYGQEATEFTENDHENLTGLLRSGVIPYNQLLEDCNPAQPTHWLKRRCDQSKTLMLPSFHEDNPKYWDHLKNRPTKLGEQYFNKLKNLSGHRRKRLWEGKWTAAEGMVYEEWNPEIHQINKTQLPIGWKEWRHYWVIDWGHIHPLVWQCWVEDPFDGTLYRVHEFYRTGWLVEDAANFIKKVTEGVYIPAATIVDHDAEDRKTWERHVTSMADPRYLTLPAYKPITLGIQAVQARLKPNWNNTGHPGILFVRDSVIGVDEGLRDAGMPTCTEEEFEGYVWDKTGNQLSNRPKDELPIDKDNHGMDCTRYIVAFIDSIAEDPQEFEEVVEFGDEVLISRY